MQAEIVMIGTELLLGQVVDTNAAFMGRVLAENGLNLYQKTTVGDNPGRIRAVLDAALNRADVVLTSGGLGPTEDDITRECVGELLGRPLEFRQDLCDHIEALLARFGRSISENNKKQAYVPQGAIAIENPNGTAPGLIVDDPRGVIVCMPGVPGELRAMLVDRVIPYLRSKFGIQGLIHSRVLKVCGLGESQVDDAIGELIRSEQNPTVGVLASPDAVRIRVSARAQTIEEANRLIDPVDADVRARLPGRVMGVDDDTIESVIDGFLKARGWTLAAGEYGAGGVVTRRLAANCTQFLGGIVGKQSFDAASADAAFAETAAHEAKDRFSADTALGMAADIRAQRMAAALITPKETLRWDLPGADDDRSRRRAATYALEHVRRFLAGLS